MPLPSLLGMLQGSLRIPGSVAAAAALAGLLSLACACSDSSSSSGQQMSGLQPFGSAPGSAAGAAAVAAPPSVIDGFGRAPGMPIGTGAPDDPAGAAPAAPPAASGSGQDSDDVEIPVFDQPGAPAAAPCSGCVELSAILDDINQRSDFAFDAGGVQVTRVVWTILLTFNSDQLFIRSFVDGNEGPYTGMGANVFGQLGTPVQFVQTFSGTATNVGIAFGSQGAWTGDQRISVYVDSVTLEGPNSVTRTFDADAGGFAPRGGDRQPMVQFR